MFAKSKDRFKKELIMCKLGVPHCFKWVWRRGEGDVEKPTSDKDVVLQRELDAAYALLELANECPSLSKNVLHSCFGNPSMKVATMDSDKGSYSSVNCDSWVSKRTPEKHFQKYRESADEDCDIEHFSLSKAAYPAERMCKRRKVGNDYFMSYSKCTNGYVGDIDDHLYETYEFMDGHEPTIRLGDTGRQHIRDYLSGGDCRLYRLLSGSNWATKKLRGKPAKPLHESPNLKKWRSQKADAKAGYLVGAPFDLPLSERKCSDNVLSETKLLKQSPFALITPTNEYGFSFSIIHLLSAVRIAMIMPYIEDDLVIGKHFVKSNSNSESEFHCHANKGMGNSELTGNKNLPSLTLHEIVQRVKFNPGDPSVLETEEPLQDLVRGVLKIFTSKVAPRKAKGWKALTTYEMSSQSWTWSGPVAISSPNHDALEEDTSPEAWGIPCKMLVKLVDSFADLLKRGQETLQQIRSLPAPPPTLMQPTVDIKESCRHPTNKSFTTISMSSEEARAYFRTEEALRYQIPDRAFSYTAVDGKKSTVAPAGRCGRKPSSKGRNSVILKPDRPPHVTTLCSERCSC